MVLEKEIKRSLTGQNVWCLHLVVILHPILVVRPAVTIHKNSPATSQGAFDSIVFVLEENHLALGVTCKTTRDAR